MRTSTPLRRAVESIGATSAAAMGEDKGMSIDNIAAFLKCRMERVAIGFSKNARLLKMLRIEVIPMPLDHPEKGDIL
jgi:hypothetical protein